MQLLRRPATSSGLPSAGSCPDPDVPSGARVAKPTDPIRRFSPRPSAARAVDRYLPVAPDAHEQAVNAPKTERLASSAAKPNVPPMARPAPSDQRPPHLPLPAGISNEK